MAYLELMQSGLTAMAGAGEAGRHSLDAMLGPINGAVSDMAGAANELEGLPFIGPEAAAKAKRLLGAVNSAQGKVNKVVNTYNQAQRTVAQIDERVSALQGQVARAGTALMNIGGKANALLGNVFPTAFFAAKTTPAAEAVTPFPHLLILSPLEADAPPYYFNLDTAAFDELRRQTAFRWAGQERLTRRPAQQAVGLGDEKISLKGAIYPAARGGLGQLNTLRSLAGRLLPLNLTTGYGEVLGNWCLTSIDEDQSALLQGGIPRKQGFSLEFVRYGDDMQNV